MKRVLIIFFIYLSALNVFSQFGPLSMAFTYGYKITNNLEWKSLNRFIDSYNTVMGSRLVTPMSHLTIKGGSVIGCDIQFMSIHIDLNWSKQSAHTIANIVGGESRELDMTIKTFYGGTAVLYPIKDFVDIGFMIGMIKYKGNLLSGYRYRNDFISYGEDKMLNGVFKMNNPLIAFGPRIDFGYKWIKISIKAEKSWDAIPSPELPSYDPMNNIPSGGTTYDDGDLHRYLPENFYQQNDKYVYSMIRNTCIYGGITGWSYIFSIRVAPLYISKKK